MNSKALQGFVEYWKPILRLSDWDIEISAVNKSTIGGDDGACWAYPDLKEAEIKVIRSNPSSRFADHETIVVHEMIHCHLERVRTDENSKDIEVVVEDISKAFVRLDRRDRG